VPIEIPHSLRPVIAALPKGIRDEMDRVLNLLMTDPQNKELEIEEFTIWGIGYLATEIDGYRVLFRYLPDTGQIQLHGIGKIQ
jgi:hypothetical protein